CSAHVALPDLVPTPLLGLPMSTRSPYTTLFRSGRIQRGELFRVSDEIVDLLATAGGRGIGMGEGFGNLPCRHRTRRLRSDPVEQVLAGLLDIVVRVDIPGGPGVVDDRFDTRGADLVLGAQDFEFR